MKPTRFLLLPALTLSILFVNGCVTSSPSSAGKEFVGTWAAQDSEKDLFNIVIFENGTAITNWAKGETGAKGEFGRWEAEAGKITLTYDDGWRDILVRKGSGYKHMSYGPGAKTSDKPTNQGPASRVKGKLLPFVGVWEAASAVNDAPFFIALKSDGTALKTINPKARGTWKVVDGGAWMTWTDGWTDRIGHGKNGMTNEAWKPGAPTSGNPTGTCTTALVGTD